MIVEFEKHYLQEMFEKGKVDDKKHRLPQNVIKKYCLRVFTLQNAPNPEALYPMKSLNFERLSGDKSGIYSIRIDLKYRLEFKLRSGDDAAVTICSLQEISNHYD